MEKETIRDIIGMCLSGKLSAFEVAQQLRIEGILDCHWPDFDGDRVRNLRKELGLTQQKFAQLLETSSASLIRWEQEGAPGLAGVALFLIEKYKDDFLYALMSKTTAPTSTYRDMFLGQWSHNGESPDKTRHSPMSLPTSFGPDEITRLRDKLHLSRAEFAQLLNVTPGTIDKLCCGRARASGSALVVLSILQTHGKEIVKECVKGLKPSTRLPRKRE